MKWNRLENKMVLKAVIEQNYSNPGLWEQNNLMEEIADWCDQNHCGSWYAYDMFKFRNEKEITMFLLKWS